MYVYITLIYYIIQNTFYNDLGELDLKIGGEEMNELYYGSIAEREALANAITKKGVKTNTSDSLEIMSTNISNIKNQYNFYMNKLIYDYQKSINISNFALDKGEYIIILDGSKSTYANGYTIGSHTSTISSADDIYIKRLATGADGTGTDTGMKKNIYYVNVTLDRATIKVPHGYSGVAILNAIILRKEL